MPIETPTQTVPNIGELKEHYKKRLDRILYKELTPDNIDKFADEALDDLVLLTSDVLEHYKTNEEFNANLEQAKQQQEDDVFKKLDLPNIHEILQRVIEVREKIERLKKYISHKTESTDTVITPPQPDYHREIAGGTGQGIEDKALVPRLLTLLYLLEADLEIAKDSVKITEGTVTTQMMRKTPYIRVEIPDLRRVAYLCDEEGNASYVFDTEKLAQARLKLEEIDVNDKGDKNSLIAMYPGIGARIIYTKHWRENMSNVLSEPIPEKGTRTTDTIEEHEKQKIYIPKSEFIKLEFLSLEDLQKEVRVIYPGEGDVHKWYMKEKKNHSNWIYNPNTHFKDKGWLGWSELVGKENFLKKEFLNFTNFLKEVRSEYPGKGKARKWYNTERKKHKNWPSEPNLEYKNDGWEGWGPMVGKEPLNKDFLSFEDFLKEVRSLYTGEGDVQGWYKNERKKHKNWHSTPYIHYRDLGWKGWSEMVGKENRLKNKQ